MSATLHLYRHARIVVQNEATTATEAALAMQKNEVGCVVVSDGSRVVGVVTDRDLALRVIAAGRDPHETRLRDIMSRPAAVLDVSARHDDAIRLMRERNVRRLPLVDGRRVVGMVTMDDLLLERTATMDELVEIVRAQIVEGGPARTRRFDEWTSLARRHSRALGTKMGLLSRIQKAAVVSRTEAERALDVVLESIVRGVDEAERPQLVARLPVALRRPLRERAIGPREAISRAELDARVARGLAVSTTRAAEVVAAVGRALTRYVRASDPLGRQLPEGLRALVAIGPRRDARAA